MSLSPRMAPSPLKHAPSKFDQTWHKTDIISLDPTLLPLSRLPRAWERKPEKKISRDGKERKIWRRYTLRSQPANTARNEDPTELQDSRSRAVKKLRTRSEESKEDSAMLKGKSRPYKATRWDRRKSALPRKRTTYEDNAMDGTIEPKAFDAETPDAFDSDGDSCSISDVDNNEKSEEQSSIIMGGADSHEFSFEVANARENVMSDHEPSANCGHGQSPAQSPETVIEQGDLVVLFGSPLTRTISNEHMNQFTEDLSEPLQLGQSEVIATEQASTSLMDATVSQEDNENSDVESSTSGDETRIEALDNERFPDLSRLKDHEQVSTLQKHAATAGEQPLETEEESASPVKDADLNGEILDLEMSEVSLHLDSLSPRKTLEVDVTESLCLAEPSPEECTLTEASLQLEIQQDMEVAQVEEGPEVIESVEEDPSVHEAISEGPSQLPVLEMLVTLPSPASTDITVGGLDDIADGLTLTPAVPSSTPNGRKLRSPSPPSIETGPDDATVTMHLDDDTAHLKDFLTRVAASKANKPTNISRRISIQNRRDSDVVRQALASPRKILEDKDPNSPSKYDNDTTLDLSQTLTLNLEPGAPLSPSTGNEGTEEVDEGKSSSKSRRSTRSRKSRLPNPSTLQQQAQTPKNIAVRRADGGEPIVLKRTEAQELGLLTRANTRKNKQGAVTVTLRLMKLSVEAAALAAQDSTTASGSEGRQAKKSVRWDETLAYYQENTETSVTLSAADLESLETPDELGVSTSTTSSKPKSKQPKGRNSTPRLKRVRGLGAANGTPGKGLLAPASLLPTEVQEEKEVTRTQRLPKPPKVKKMPVASSSSDATSAGEPPVQVSAAEPAAVVSQPASAAPEAKATKERKSRLATPKRVRLPQPVVAVPPPAEGKENQHGRGIRGASPKKGLQLPQVVVPPVVASAMETALPRRKPGRRA